jgi:hypothetical protein
MIYVGSFSGVAFLVNIVIHPSAWALSVVGSLGCWWIVGLGVYQVRARRRLP